MPQLTFALQFKGSAGPVPGSESKLRAKTTAGGQALRTTLGPGGIESGIDALGGATATFESEVQMLPDGHFLEAGTIAYGGAGTVAFETIGHGVLGQSAVDGVQRGAVIWSITRGDGRLAGASGLITSNFTVSATGDVVDNQFAVLFLP
jgi:hypothetical protein